MEAEEAMRFREIVMGTFRVAGASNIQEFLPFLRKFGFRDAERELQEVQQKRDDFMQSLLEEQKRTIKSGGHGSNPNSDDGKNKTLVQVLLSLQEKEPEYYSDVTIRGMMSVSPIDSSRFWSLLDHMSENPRPFTRESNGEYCQLAGSVSRWD